MDFRKAWQAVRQMASALWFRLRQDRYERKFSSDTFIELICDGDLRSKVGSIPFEEVQVNGGFWRN